MWDGYGMGATWMSGGWPAWQEYWRDAFERSVLTADVLRRRGNDFIERSAQTAPNVLNFDAEFVLDGRELPKPVNYGLLRIVPPAGTSIDPRKRPFIVFDPRAGHGPGIGGMKHDSEIGVALGAGHPCYFVGFLPQPVPGQTVADVCLAEARFVEEVISRHPESEGRPVLIGNCQAGWQIMMMASLCPDLVGPIMLAGSPLSYWAGVRGRNPMRYLGGLLGGTWLSALAGDVGHGIFDGANLVANFEALHPSNALWTKLYGLYSRVDTETGRFLEFEKWWGSPVLLDAGEMLTIAHDLFVGNKLTSGELHDERGLRIDLRNITSPIIVFCSHGDDITPPQQALDWVLDLYEDEREIEAAGQTIVYCLHQSIGHLGIFVSGKVASKEHDQFAHAMDLIDLLPPGLYEAVITAADGSTAHPELLVGNYVLQLKVRTLDDIRALGTNTPEDDREFAAVARVSDINLGLYRSFLAPLVQAMASAPAAEMMRALHPNRLRFGMFSDQNPFMRPFAAWADSIRADRHPASPNNPLAAMERQASEGIVKSLDGSTAVRDSMQEAIFHGVYGSALLQAMVGLAAETPSSGRRISRDLARELAAAKILAELQTRLAKGGLLEAGVRAMIYVHLPEGTTDERDYNALERIAAEHKEARIGFAQFKQIVREQCLLLMHDPERAIAALGQMLPPDAAQRAEMLDIVRRVATARGALTEGAEQRLAQIAALFEGRAAAGSSPPPDGPARRSAKAPGRSSHKGAE
jgi:pimeloyl-ACP methyl ester carboxylesterase